MLRSLLGNHLRRHLEPLLLPPLHLHLPRRICDGCPQRLACILLLLALWRLYISRRNKEIIHILEPDFLNHPPCEIINLLHADKPEREKLRQERLHHLQILEVRLLRPCAHAGIHL